MTTTHLAVVAHALDVPLETLSAWHAFRPEAFHAGPDGYSVATIAQAGRDWMNRRPYEVLDLLHRLERAAAVVLGQGELFGDVAAHFRRIAPTVIELARGEQSPKSLSTLRAIVEAAIARCRAAGLDVADVKARIWNDTGTPPSRTRALEDEEL